MIGATLKSWRCECVYISFICYPTACSPKGYGSGLPLPFRTARPISRLLKKGPNPAPNVTTFALYRGYPISSPYLPKKRVAKREQNTKQGNQKDQPCPPGLLFLHLLQAGFDPRLGLGLARTLPLLGAGASSSGASLPASWVLRSPIARS